MEITKNRTKYDLCKFLFANRIVNIWNSLPSHMVSAETVNCFKTRLDRFWLNQLEVLRYIIISWFNQDIIIYRKTSNKRPRRLFEQSANTPAFSGDPAFIRSFTVLF